MEPIRLIDVDAHPKAISERMCHSEIGVTMNVRVRLVEILDGLDLIELTKTVALLRNRHLSDE